MVVMPQRLMSHDACVVDPFVASMLCGRSSGMSVSNVYRLGAFCMVATE